MESKMAASMVPTKKSLSLAEKIVLQEGIPKLDIQEKTEDLKSLNCMQCHQVASSQVQLQCSHVLCDDCFATLHSSPCPVPACEMRVTPSEVEDDLLEEALSEITVTYQNKENGCTDAVPLSNLLAHEECNHYSQQSNKDANDFGTCMQKIMDLQQQVAELKTFVLQLQNSCGQPCPRTEIEIKEIVAEEIRKERAKEQLNLEKRLTKTFEHCVDEKMHLVLTTIEDILQSKQEEDFQKVENLICIQVKENCDVMKQTTSRELQDDVNRFQKGLERDILNKANEMNKLLEEKSTTFIQDVLDAKCPEMEMRSLKEVGVFQRKIETILKSNLETDFHKLERHMWTKLQDNCDAIQETMTKRATEKFGEAVHGIQEGLESHLLDKTNDIKKSLLEESKVFIEEVLDVNCWEMEKRSFDNLAGSVQKQSDEIGSTLKIELNNEIKGNLAKATKNLQNNVKEEVKLKWSEVKEETFKELEKELTEICQREEENMKSDVLRALYYFQLKSNVTSLSQAVNHLLPKSKTFIWDIGNFKGKIEDDRLKIESDIFDIPEFGCKIRLSFRLKGWSYYKPYSTIEVDYLEQATDEVNPLNGHHRITFTLKDQVEDNIYKDYIRIFEPSFDNRRTQTLGYPHNLANEELAFLHSRWLKDGKIQMRVTLEPLVHLVTTEPPHYGSLIWKIDHYSDVCESFRYGRQWAFSKSFYSSERGYRLKGEFYIGGEVSFRLYFLKSPWDKDLPEEFNHRTILCIISQDDKGLLKNKTFSEESSEADCDYFTTVISEADLRKYVKNDSLIISFKIEPL